MDLILNGNTLTGSATNSRFRMYVPDGDTYVDYYKGLFTTFANQIYKTGTIVESYTVNTHDIGKYTIKPITLNNYSGTPVNGYEIIEYHGADLTSAYTIPVELTIDTTTLPVISIGRDAFINTTMTTGNSIDISNTVLINIGARAFNGFTGIDSITASGITTLGTYAFNNTDIEEAIFANLNSIGAYTFGNMAELYKLDLGKVQTMPANSVYNIPYLQQVFFTGVSITMTFNTAAITNVGTASNDRIRFYVTDALASNDQPYVNIYKALFASEYQTYFFPMGYIVGSYTQPGMTNDIGIYSVREVTLDDYGDNPVTGWEMVEYHGEDLPNAYTIPASVTANGNNYSIISIGPNAYNHTESVPSAVIDIVNSNLINISTNAFYEMEGIRKVEASGVTTLGANAFRYSTVREAIFIHLDTTGTYALANMSTLNMVNLGTVTTIGDGLLYNCSNINQIFFTSTNDSSTTMNMSIGTDAFYNVRTVITEK